MELKKSQLSPFLAKKKQQSFMYIKSFERKISFILLGYVGE